MQEQSNPKSNKEMTVLLSKRRYTAPRTWFDTDTSITRLLRLTVNSDCQLVILPKDTNFPSVHMAPPQPPPPNPTSRFCLQPKHWLWYTMSLPFHLLECQNPTYMHNEHTYWWGGGEMQITAGHQPGSNRPWQFFFFSPQSCILFLLYAHPLCVWKRFLAWDRHFCKKNDFFQKMMKHNQVKRKSITVTWLSHGVIWTNGSLVDVLRTHWSLADILQPSSCICVCVCEGGGGPGVGERGCMYAQRISPIFMFIFYPPFKI